MRFRVALPGHRQVSWLALPEQRTESTSAGGARPCSADVVHHARGLSAAALTKA